MSAGRSGGRLTRRLGGRGDRVGPGPRQLDDALAADEVAQLGGLELAGPRERRQAGPDGIDVGQPVVGDDGPDHLAVAGSLVDHRDQRRARPAAGLDQPVEGGEPRRLASLTERPAAVHSAASAARPMGRAGHPPPQLQPGIASIASLVGGIELVVGVEVAHVARPSRRAGTRRRS